MKSMRIAMQDLKLERLWVVYLGKIGYPMDNKIECVSLAELSRIRKALAICPSPLVTRHSSRTP
jgi:hypothetical protein